jgi:diacylglycerol kinase family enzyme
MKPSRRERRAPGAAAAHVDVNVVDAPVRPFILMNPRSGNGKVRRFALDKKAELLGATVMLLHGGEDLPGVIRRAVDDGADLVGVAGGDGTLGVVAATAADLDIPLLVIPAGTRNHFALDLGLDRVRPAKALDALVHGFDAVVDLGLAGDRPFVNTASFGAYAEIVERPDYRDSKLRVSLQVLAAAPFDRDRDRFSVQAGALTVDDPAAALVSNNPYGARHTRGPARRPRLDTGMLGLVCVERPPEAPTEVMRERGLHRPVTVTTSRDIVVAASARSVLAAIDGESARLDVPVRCTVRPRALRVRLPLDVGWS